MHFNQRGCVVDGSHSGGNGMESKPEPKSQVWTPKQVYLMSAICLVVGLAFGYFFRGSSATNAKPQTPVASAAGSTQAPSAPPAKSMPSLDDMKRMADKQAEPLLTQLKNDPKNAQLLVKIGNTYKSAHQFDEAANYFGQALQINPKDTAIRDEVGAAQYYSGDFDRAIATFEEGLKYSPNDVSTLYDLGVMKLQKKNDAKAAVALWERLLKNNPQLSADKRQQVEKMIVDAKSGNRLASN